MKILTREDIEICKVVAVGDLGIMQEILAEISTATGFSESLIVGRRRTPALSRARQLAYFVGHRSGIPSTVIARAMHRDHSTVLYGIKAEAARRTVGKPMMPLEKAE